MSRGSFVDGIAVPLSINLFLRKNPMLKRRCHKPRLKLNARYGKNIANPIGQIWSGALMLDHLGYPEAGAQVFAAIESVLSAGPAHAPLTPDIGGKASTQDLGKAIAAAI